MATGKVYFHSPCFDGIASAVLSASHNDVTSHVCYREFSIALNGAGHLVLT